MFMTTCLVSGTARKKMSHYTVCYIISKLMSYFRSAAPFILVHFLQKLVAPLYLIVQLQAMTSLANYLQALKAAACNNYKAELFFCSNRSPIQMASSLRKKIRVNYKEPKESDIFLTSGAHVAKSSTPSSSGLFPIRVVQEDSLRYKVHYVGYSSKYDERKEKSEVVDLDNCDHDDQEPLSTTNILHFSLYHELAIRIKSALNSSRKESPKARIDMPFDRVQFNGGLVMSGERKRYVRGIQHYTITNYQDLNGLLGSRWHYRGINSNGDYCYVILSTVEYYLYRRRSLKEYVPTADSSAKEEHIDTGDMLVFTFVKGNGTPNNFGKDTAIFF